MKNELQPNTLSRHAEKQEIIMRAAFELICQKDLDRVTTTEIARHADVSIGTLYKYYPNKKAIVLDAYELYFYEIAAPLLEMLKSPMKPFAMRELFEYLIDVIVQGHSYASKKTHDEMMALIHFDEDFKRRDRQCKLQLVDKLIPVITGLGVPAQHIREKLHFLLNLMELYAHEVAYRETEVLDYIHIKENMIDIISDFILE